MTQHDKQTPRWKSQHLCGQRSLDKFREQNKSKSLSDSGLNCTLKVGQQYPWSHKTQPSVI